MRGTRTTIVGIVSHQVNHGFAGEPWLRIQDKKKTPPERGAAAALGAVLLGPHKAPLVPPPIHTAQHERAGRAPTGKRDQLYRWAAIGGSLSGAAILHCLARRTAPVSSQAVGRQKKSPANRPREAS